MSGMHRAMLAGLVLAASLFAPIAAPVATAQTPDAPRSEQIEGRNTLRYIPAEPRGLIFLFHGSGGSENFATNDATQQTLAPFMKAGYGFAASASLQREEPQRWDLTSGDPQVNADVAYMLDLHRRLVASGEIKADTPVFTMGMSNGGGMANLFGLAAKQAGLPVKAVANYMGPFPAPMTAMIASGAKPAPTFVVVAERDGLVSHANVLAAAGRVKEMGVTVETHLKTETTLTPTAFTGIGGMDTAASAAIFDNLVKLGVVDASGKRLFATGKPTITREDQAALRDMLPEGENRRAIYSALLTTWGAHMMRSDLADEQFAFFEAARGQ